jgi:MFS family permease
MNHVTMIFCTGPDQHDAIEWFRPDTLPTPMIHQVAQGLVNAFSGQIYSERYKIDCKIKQSRIAMKGNHNIFKKLLLIISGNIFEYYDFLLFAHIGHFIIPHFIPEHYAQQSHLLSLVLFALPFVARPIGGYFFGKMADTLSTDKALNHTLLYAGMASLMIALLPGHQSLGIASIIIFTILRSLQGFALGGEYTTAGTILMDAFPENRYFISGVLGASGTIGSMIAFLFAEIYFHFFPATQVWRLFFVLGGIVTYYSAYRRKNNPYRFPQKVSCASLHIKVTTRTAIYQTLALGAVTSVTCFVPMIYSYFYLTKILNMPTTSGLMATFISLMSYILLTPAVGYISDRVSIHRIKLFYMAIPMAIIGFYALSQKWILGQIPLTLSASLAGANIHVWMNEMFPLQTRSRNINVYFTIGASLGGLVPPISGYMHKIYALTYTPTVVTCILLALNIYLFKNALHKERHENKNHAL